MSTALDQRELQNRAWLALDAALGRENAARFFREHGEKNADVALQERGLHALEQELGAEGARQFFLDFTVLDYTEERHLWLDGTTVDEVAARIEKRRAAGVSNAV